jgi:predicted outer membrane repeat protein
MKTTQQSDLRAPRTSRRHARVFARLFVAAGAASAVLLGASSSNASLYYVYTSATSAMSLNANDNYCSLAEAIASVNAGSKKYDCVDQDATSGTQTISLREASGKSFAQYHYVVTSFTITGTAGQVRIEGSGALIDSTGISGFIIRPSSSLFMQRATLTYTGGASGGRLIENYGTLSLYGITLTKGNVTAHPNGLGGALYNEGTIPSIGNSLLSGNQAKRGGAIYNKDGRITGLNAIISGNSATMAGGGIYNMATGLNQSGTPKAYIDAGATTITTNSARAGGGVFNRGEINMESSTITFNSVSGTGSNETCVSSQSCDGAGAGVLVVSTSTINAAFRSRDAVTLSDNKASGLGGAVYSAGIINLLGVTIARNQASDGAAIYAVAVGSAFYCNLQAGSAPSSIIGNKTVPAGKYSIVDTTGVTCVLQASGSGNVSPTCAQGSFVAPCPQ